ncbi:MAG TPA: hypothetical protein VMT97_01650 [Terriglobales bacterium]|nr:hypothetical protein [Terriglobales bacterium]
MPSASGRHAAVKIACINKARTDLRVDFDRMIRALQTFLDECLAPVWHTPARLVKSRRELAGAWTLVFLDDADRAQLLGYHKLMKNGLPLAKVFVKPSLEGGEPISVVASHELAEMLVDPGDNLWCVGPKGRFYAYEVCDPVEQEQFKLDGIPMSDFLYPAYFQKQRASRPAPLDYSKRIKRPFQVLPGGYSVVRTRGRKGILLGSRAKERQFKAEDRRFHRSEYR